MRATAKLSAIEHRILVESLRRVPRLRPDVAMVMAEILEADEHELDCFADSLTPDEAAFALSFAGAVIRKTGECA